MPSQRVVKLTVINDLICPNCCIGQHELLSAINHCQNVLHLSLKFELEFLPYRLISTKALSEDMPTIQKSDFYVAKVGTEHFKTMQAGIANWSKEKGIAISFKGVMSQSTRGHRLSRKAYLMGGQKLQLPLLCGLYKAHLEEGVDIADFDVLADIAETAGVMTRDEALAFLKSDELEAEVNELCDNAKSQGVSGVPMVVIDGKWAVSGGQSSEVFVQIFRKLAEAGMHTAHGYVDSDSSSSASTPTAVEAC